MDRQEQKDKENQSIGIIERNGQVQLVILNW